MSAANRRVTKLYEGGCSRTNSFLPFAQQNNISIGIKRRTWKGGKSTANENMNSTRIKSRPRTHIGKADNSNVKGTSFTLLLSPAGQLCKNSLGAQRVILRK